jgi:hypothetical protein
MDAVVTEETVKVTTDVEKIIAEEYREREYVEIITSLRHYSNLRFAVLSVFYGVTAGLIVGALGFPVVEGMKMSAATTLLLKILGVFVTVALYLYDFMIDGYQVAFRKHLKKIWPESHWFTRPAYSNYFQWPVRSLYIIVLVFWVFCVVYDPYLRSIVKGIF